MRAWRAVKWVGVGLLLLALGLGAFVFGKISNVAEEQLDLRCADLARGKLIVAEVDALVTKNSACPVDEMQARTRAADDAGEKWPWDIDIDPRDCGYALHRFTRPGWPVGASVRLDYDSRTKKWELLSEGDHSGIECP